MKILVQVLRLRRDNSRNNNMVFVVDSSLTEEISTVTKAMKRCDDLALSFPDHKIRIIEYHNDEPDNIRKPCKVLRIKNGWF